MPGPKNDFSRAKVRSMNWSTTTKVPGARSSRSEPTALSDTISVTPARFRASMLARERSEEHTSELQSLMRISYAVFCLKKKNHKYTVTQHARSPQLRHNIISQA